MEGRFAGRTWKLAGIAKFVLQLGQQSKQERRQKYALTDELPKRNTAPRR